MKALPFQRLILLIAAVCSLSLSACGKRITDANLKQVRPDMSTKEVESILGPPSKSSTHELELETQKARLPATTYIYEQDGKSVQLYFVGDKLVTHGGVQGQFGE
jgi:uncharacterized lipoprotein YehR (DUF1307 family)